MSIARATLLACAATLFFAGAADAACVQIRTVQDLNRIRSNLSGDFCLANDLDLAAVANFVPIGFGGPNFFTGTFDGQGHAIRNLKISRGGPNAVGFFSILANPARVSNLNLVDVNVQHPAVAGADPTFAPTKLLGGLTGMNHSAAIIENWQRERGWWPVAWTSF